MGKAFQIQRKNNCKSLEAESRCDTHKGQKPNVAGPLKYKSVVSGDLRESDGAITSRLKRKSECLTESNGM